MTQASPQPPKLTSIVPVSDMLTAIRLAKALLSPPKNLSRFAQALDARGRVVDPRSHLAKRWNVMGALRCVASEPVVRATRMAALTSLSDPFVQIRSSHLSHPQILAWMDEATRRLGGEP